MIHNAWAVVNIIARLLCRFLIDCVNAFNLVLLMINKIRNGVACVGTCNDRSRVVGQNHNFVIIILFKPFKKNRQNSFINKLNCSYLIFRPVSFTSFALQSFSKGLNKDITSSLEYPPTKQKVAVEGDICLV